MRELLQMALSEVVANKRTGEKKAREEWVAAAIIQKAMQGDVSAFRAMVDTLGESAPMKIDASVKQEQSVEVSFGDMDVETLATFLADVKKQHE